MPLQYFAREGDPVEVVYEVDFAAGTWRVLDADKGEPNNAGEILYDDTGRPTFLGVEFFEVQVDDVIETEDTISFSFWREMPVHH